MKDEKKKKKRVSVEAIKMLERNLQEFLTKQ